MSAQNQDIEMDPFPWELGVYDAHCHATDTMSSIESIPRMKATGLAIMATRAEDQELVASVADKLGFDTFDSTKPGASDRRMIPCFGWHPWFSHHIYDDLSEGSHQMDGHGRPWKHVHYQNVLVPKPEDSVFLDALPDPRPLSDLISQTRKYLEKYPLALVGEIGLDKAFCLPNPWSPEGASKRDTTLTPGGREGRTLSPYRVAMPHQRKILHAQLKLAGEMGRAVSVHGVQAPGIVFDVLQETWKGHERKVVSKRSLKRKGPAAYAQGAHDTGMTGTEESGPRPYPPRVCLHSYSGLPDALREYYAPTVPADVYFSFSSVINFSSPSSKAVDVIKKVPEDRLLVESDLHCAGDRMDSYLEDITRLVCKIRGWNLEDGVAKLGRNWRRFIFGQEDMNASFCSTDTSATTKFIL